MNLRHWMNNHGLIALLAVLLVTACATTISVATRVGTASALRERTQQLTQRVQESKPESDGADGPTQGDDAPVVEPGADGDRPRGGSRSRGGRREIDPTDPAQVAAARIDSRRLFTNPPSPAFRNVIGVLGNYALYPDGEMVAVGDQRAGATIRIVGPDFVEFDYEGETVRVDVNEQDNPGGFDRGNAGPGSRPGGGRFGGSGGRGGPGGRGEAGRGGDPAAREAMRQRMREQFGGGRNLSPEQIEEMRARFREQRGGRGGDND